ncbi:NmrA family NAD(P)-binding protein [Acidisoma cladoniae]|uniref:NmrA family NAD(P)-binding protein n=1 Tax=Acidisoma cladoniae TaxID=3040935 RepID=UPI00254B86E3|nr:NmrA family NAD(P)-binding protein [Acidisoma sp. PAMC 29798]
MLLSPLLARGAKIIQGNLADSASLDRATMGVDVIVSAVQGGPDVIHDGQLALLEAAKKNGVRRILPSDFALDLFETPNGEHPPFDLRRAADQAIAASGLEHVHVLNGVFMDVFLSPRSMFDRHHATARLWGDGQEWFGATSVDDTARYAARAALDRGLPSGKFAVAGQVLSFDDVASAFEQATGQAFTRERLGSVTDLRAFIAGQRAHDPMAATIGTYVLYMLTEPAALRDLQNGRYPDIHPCSFAQFLERALTPAGASRA